MCAIKSYLAEMQRILCSKYFYCKNSILKIFEGDLHLYCLELMLFYYLQCPMPHHKKRHVIDTTETWIRGVMLLRAPGSPGGYEKGLLLQVC